MGLLDENALKEAQVLRATNKGFDFLTDLQSLFLPTG
jgi:hypothetical protein